jgi:DHA1 family inner membrane transport protein
MRGVPRASQRLAIVVTLSAGAFVATSTSIGVAPFLLDIARDLQVDLPAAGNLVALQNLSWGAASVFAGTLSDRLGRRPILSTALVILAVSSIGVARADSYAWVAFWRVVGGFGGGAYMGTVFATVSDQFPPAERGRSLGWVVTGQSLSLVVGVPLMTLAGAAAGWRGAVLAQGLVLISGAAAIWQTVPRRPARAAEQPIPLGSVVRLIGPRVIALLLANTAERLCYSALAVFLPTYLLTRYALSPAELAIGLAIVAIGNLMGNVVGGQLTDRLRARQLFAAATLALAGLVSLPVLIWSPALAVSVALGFVYTFVNAAGRPGLLAVLSDVSTQARGAVLGLNITFSSFGWLGATGLGGALVALAGFGALGVLTCAFGVVGALLAIANWLTARPRARLVVAPGER